MIRPMGFKMPPLICAWNRDFSKQSTRRDNIRRFMRCELRSNPKGRGNKAWKRYESMMRDPAYLVWPDYAFKSV
jgi:hypothetical protein